MPLRHETVKTVRAPLDECMQCILRVDRLLGVSKHTEKVERVSPGVYHVRFVWKKFGITKHFDVVFRSRREGSKVVYESIEGSKYPMRMEFELRRRPDGLVEIRVLAEMRAGLMAEVFGRKDFARFVEELVDSGIVRLLQARAAGGAQKEGKRVAEARCDKCLLYDPVKNYCYYLRKPVFATAKPPCGGEAFIPLREEG